MVRLRICRHSLGSVSEDIPLWRTSRIPCYTFQLLHSNRIHDQRIRSCSSWSGILRLMVRLRICRHSLGNVSEDIPLWRTSCIPCYTFQLLHSNRIHVQRIRSCSSWSGILRLLVRPRICRHSLGNVSEDIPLWRTWRIPCYTFQLLHSNRIHVPHIRSCSAWSGIL